MKKPITCLGVVLLLTTTLAAEEWPSWRGPRGDGTSLETNVPVRWSETENLVWKVPIPGIGHSSPIVWGDRIFVTSCVEKTLDRLLLCFDRRDGRLLWKKVVLNSTKESKHKLNSYASSTPATDGERVYVVFLQNPLVEIVCYDTGGKELWRKSPGKFLSPHGFCSSPLLYKDLIIVNCDQDARLWKNTTDRSYIVALDKRTGEEKWRIDRPHKIRSYCAPLIVEAAGKMQMVLSGTKCVTSYDPDSGQLLWIIDGPTEQYVASLVYGQGLFFLTAGFPEFHNMAIRPDGTGNVTKTHIQWHEKKTSPQKASYVPSPVAHDKYFFLVSDLGVAHCFDARTGKRLWMQGLGRHHSASPVSVGDLLYFPDDDGNTWVVKAGPKFDLVSKNSVDDEVYASLAISRGQIILRGLHNLYCIGAPEGGAKSGSARK
jgi:outer membrane protein assembly factor BamB